MRIVCSMLVVLCVGPLLVLSAQTPTPQASPPPTVVSVSSAFASYPSLEAQAKEIGEALLRKDFERFAALTHPKPVELGGGKEKFISSLVEEAKQHEKIGLETISLTPSDATEFLKVSSSLYAVMPTTSRLKMGGELFESHGCLIGVSKDDGKHWVFLELGSVDRLKDLLPEFDGKLKLKGCPPKRPLKPELTQKVVQLVWISGRKTDDTKCDRALLH